MQSFENRFRTFPVACVHADLHVTAILLLPRKRPIDLFKPYIILFCPWRINNCNKLQFCCTDVLQPLNNPTWDEYQITRLHILFFFIRMHTSFTCEYVIHFSLCQFVSVSTLSGRNSGDGYGIRQFHRIVFWM